MKKIHVTLISLTAGTLLLGSVVVQATSQDSLAREQDVVLAECLVLPQDMIDVPAKEEGQLTIVDVVEGEYVESSRVLALIDDERAKMELFVAETRANAAKREADNENAILEAQAALRVATSDLDREKRLREKNASPQEDLDHAQLQFELAEFQLANKRYEKTIAIEKAKVEAKTAEAAQTIVDRHQIAAPFAGNVFRIYKNRGEWVEVGQPVLQMARMDVLRVEGQIDGTRYNPEEIMGKQVTVSVERARGETLQFNGRIVFVDLRQSSLKRYQVRAEVNNQQANGFWLLNPGADAKMTIHLR